MARQIRLMTIPKFAKLLPKICGRDTSFDPKGWTKENPLWGHCAVVALLAQSLFLGEILYVSLQNTKFASLKLHFWNSLPSGWQKDFTRVQFGKEYPADLVIKTATPLMFRDKSAQRRFKLLQERFMEECKKDE